MCFVPVTEDFIRWVAISHILNVLREKNGTARVEVVRQLQSPPIVFQTCPIYQLYTHHAPFTQPTPPELWDMIILILPWFCMILLILVAIPIVFIMGNYRKSMKIVGFSYKIGDRTKNTHISELRRSWLSKWCMGCVQLMCRTSLEYNRRWLELPNHLNSCL